MFCLLAGHRGWCHIWQKDTNIEVICLTSGLQLTDVLFLVCVCCHLCLFPWWTSVWWVSDTLLSRWTSRWTRLSRPPIVQRHHSTLSSRVPCCRRETDKSVCQLLLFEHVSSGTLNSFFNVVFSLLPFCALQSLACLSLLFEFFLSHQSWIFPIMTHGYKHQQKNILDLFCDYRTRRIQFACQIKVSTASSFSSPSFICHRKKGFKHLKKAVDPTHLYHEDEAPLCRLKVISGVFIYLIKPLTPKVALQTPIQVINYKLVIT